MLIHGPQNTKTVYGDITIWRTILKFWEWLRQTHHRHVGDSISQLCGNYTAFSDSMTLLVGQQEEHPACKKLSWYAGDVANDLHIS